MKKLRQGFIAPLVFLLISGLIMVVVYTIPYLTVTRGYSQATATRAQLHTLLVSAVSLWQEMILPAPKQEEGQQEAPKKPAQIQQELYNKILLKMLELQNAWHSREFKEDEHGIAARVHFYMRPSAGKIPLHSIWDAKAENFTSVKSYRPADLVLYGLSRITKQQAAQAEELLKTLGASSAIDIPNLIKKASQDFFVDNVTLYPIRFAEPTLSVIDIFTSWYIPKDPVQRIYPLFLPAKLLDTSFDFIFKPALFAEGSEYAAALKKAVADSVDWAKLWPELTPLIGIDYNTLPIHIRMSFMKSKPPLTQELLVSIEHSGYVASALAILEPVFFEKLERYHLVIRDVTVMEIRTQKEIVKQD